MFCYHTHTTMLRDFYKLLIHSICQGVQAQVAIMYILIPSKPSLLFDITNII